MFGGYDREPRADVKAVAHITGGGMPEKLKRMLAPSGLGANIFNAFEPGKAIQIFQKLGNVDDEEAYKTWNMGNGMIIATETPERVIEIANEHKIQAKIVGYTADSPELSIDSRGVKTFGKRLSFKLN